MRVMVIALGTAGSTPTKDRHMPSFAVVYEGDILLFDCGEGTQMQMLRYNVNIAKVKAIFISHTHGDHVIGIAGLVRTMSMLGRQEPLLVFVPKGYADVINNLLVFDKAILNFPILIKEVKQGKVYTAKFYDVYAFRLNHTIPTYGYVFKEHDKRHFIAEKAKAFGIKGELFSELEKKGRLKIGNRVIRLEEVTWLEPGIKIAYATDTRPSTNTVKYSYGADLLVHEAAYTSDERALAVSRKHATAKEAAEIAKKARVKELLLTHISARHREVKPLEQEAKKVFRNSIVAYDGMVINIERESIRKKSRS